jgi:hypothetical protein
MKKWWTSPMFTKTKNQNGEALMSELDLTVDEQIFAAPGAGVVYSSASAAEPQGTYTVTTTCWGPCVQQ